jgi:hypothetical protein
MADEPNQGVTGDPPNQGATGTRPMGQSPLQADASDSDPFAERPEAFVGAAFAGGFVLALLLKKWAS